jgi:excisionase family DNA binding protein
MFNVEELMSQNLLTLAQVAEHFQVSPQTVRGWIKTKKLPAVKLTRQTIRVKWADVQKLEQTQHA